MKIQRKKMNGFVFMAVTCALLTTVPAQEKPAPAPKPEMMPPVIAMPPAVQETRGVFRLQINVNETDAGKVINSRSYQMVLEESQRGTLRVTREIPIVSGPSTQYRTLGLSLQCNLTERKDFLFLNIRFSLNHVVAGDNITGQATAANPVIGSYDSELGTALKPGIPTVVTIMDSLASRNRYELEVTATKLR